MMSGSESGTSKITAAFLQNQGALRRFISRYFIRPADIDDISHEAFLRAFKAEQTTQIKNPKAFLFRVAKNVALNELTKKSTILTDYIEENSDYDVLIDETDAEGRLDEREKFRLFCQSLSSLPPQCQKVFVMRKVYGFSQKEISRALGISTSTVEKHIASGLKRSMEFMSNANAALMSENEAGDIMPLSGKDNL